MPFSSLIPWKRDGEAPVLTRFQEDMNRLVEDLFGREEWEPFAPTRPAAGGPAFLPRADLIEDADKLTIKVEIPGMKEKDIEISIVNGTLVLEGEKKEEKKEKEENCYRMERRFGRFERHIPLPFEVEFGKSTATYANGVLTVQLPKSPRARAAMHRIEVKAG